MRQNDFAFEWFQRHVGQKFSPEEIELLLPQAYFDEFGKGFRDPMREARKLARAGRLQRGAKGTSQAYWYNAELDVQPEAFSEMEKTQILERDGFRCVICGQGPSVGIPVFVGYAKSARRGGQLDVDNGRTLCGIHRWILETAQESDECVANFRRLREKLPQIGESPNATRFWNDFVELLKKYQIDPTT